MGEHIALWLVGPPGVGKTTLAKLLLGFPEVGTIPKPKWTVALKKPWCAAGWYAGTTFDGADTVPYNGAAEALTYWKANLLGQPDLRITLFDGDRFSNQNALSFVEEALALVPGSRTACLHLTAGPDILQARREQRGSKQSPSWMLGRATKAARFAEKFLPPCPSSRRCATLSAAVAPEQLHEGASAFIDSILRAE